MKLREKTTATFLLMLFLASAFTVALVPVLARGGSARGTDVSWVLSGVTYSAIFLETPSGLIHGWRYEPDHLHAVYKPADRFPDPGEGWVLHPTSGITAGIAELDAIFGDSTHWWVYINYQSD